MLPSRPLDIPAGPEPRIGGPVRDLEEEEELQLALTILRLVQRLSAPPGAVRARP